MHLSKGQTSYVEKKLDSTIIKSKMRLIYKKYFLHYSNNDNICGYANGVGFNILKKNLEMRHEN